MSLLSVFANGEVIVASVIYAIGAILEPLFEATMRAQLKHNTAYQWLWKQFLGPLIRAVMVVSFVYFAYPGLFGLREAPSFSAIIESGDARTSTLVSMVFLAGICASLIPGIGRKPEIVLPLQSSLAAAYLFVWLTAYLGITTARIWPGIDVVLSMIIFSMVGHRVGKFAGKQFGDYLDQRSGRRDFDVVFLHVAQLLAQVPVVLVYGYGLGRQIAI